ncbi:unnamed protein product [Protopolystoma xenopodis]|uniref:Uncharacterized protein n=1 Tax=Protopolystoma xenopodis TaxID=117903 RepID=A0A3S5B7R3_9PLAT|nr:unnamed protein product [Protopolystoma xenopodis]
MDVVSSAPSKEIKAAQPSQQQQIHHHNLNQHNYQQQQQQPKSNLSLGSSMLINQLEAPHHLPSPSSTLQTPAYANLLGFCSSAQMTAGPTQPMEVATSTITCHSPEAEVTIRSPGLTGRGIRLSRTGRGNTWTDSQSASGRRSMITSPCPAASLSTSPSSQSPSASPSPPSAMELGSQPSSPAITAAANDIDTS